MRWSDNDPLWARCGVSRETRQQLKRYADYLVQWQPKINLVSNNTLEDAMHRHFIDSAQLLPFLPNGPHRILDMGSGAGFPGLVMAIARPDCDVLLCDVDQRKMAFIRHVAGQLSLVNVRFHEKRLEPGTTPVADVYTSRALANLYTLISLLKGGWRDGAQAHFLKGKNVQEELAEAQIFWQIEASTTPSITDPDAAIVHIHQFKADQ